MVIVTRKVSVSRNHSTPRQLAQSCSIFVPNSEPKRSYFSKQSHYIYKMKPINPNAFTEASFILRRARGSYFSAVYHPDVSFAFSSASQSLDAEGIKERFAIMQPKCVSIRPRSFQNLVLLIWSQCSVRSCVDAWFATKADFLLQLGFITVMMDDGQRPNIVHFVR